MAGVGRAADRLDVGALRGENLAVQLGDRVRADRVGGLLHIVGGGDLPVGHGELYLYGTVLGVLIRAGEGARRGRLGCGRRRLRRGWLVGALLGVVRGEAVAVVAGVVFVGAVATGVVLCVVFFAVLVGDGLAEEEAASELPFAEVVGGAVTDSPVGALVLATATPATWDLYENSAARPATVPPRTRTARRMKSPSEGLLQVRSRRTRGGCAAGGCPASVSALTAAWVMPVGPHTYAS